MSASEMDQIRSRLANEFHTIFEREMMNAGYMLSSENGDDVLSIAPAIVNLYITGAQHPKLLWGRTYVANTGDMSLVLELRDSVSGQLLGPVVDTQQPGGGLIVTS